MHAAVSSVRLARTCALVLSVYLSWVAFLGGPVAWMHTGVYSDLGTVNASVWIVPQEVI